MGKALNARLAAREVTVQAPGAAPTGPLALQKDAPVPALSALCGLSRARTRCVHRCADARWVPQWRSARGSERACSPQRVESEGSLGPQYNIYHLTPNISPELESECPSEGGIRKKGGEYEDRDREVGRRQEEGKRRSISPSRKIYVGRN